MSPMMDKITGV